MNVWNMFVADSMNTVMTFHRENKLHIKNWPLSNDEGFKQFVNVYDFWAGDLIGAFKQRHSLSSKPYLFHHHHIMTYGL